MNRLLEMQIFATVVDAGSFVAAAQTLGVSKAAVSRHVSELEARLGARLLQRTTRRLSLTSEGAVFYGRCKNLLADVEEAEAEVSSRTTQAAGLLRVNVPVSYGLLQLAPLWAPFLAQHPRLQLDVTLSDRVVDLVEEGYDVAVRIARLPASTLVSRQLASTRLILCASPGYLQANGTPEHPGALSQHTVLAYNLLASGNVWSFAGPHGSISVKVAPRVISNSGDTCRRMALMDAGIILQPSFLLDRDLQRGTLVELLPQYRSTELGVYALYPTRKHLSAKVRALVDYLVQALGPSATGPRTGA